MGWVIVVVAVIAFAAVVRRLMRGRRSPQVDQSRLEQANYSRIGQDVHNFDQRFGHGG